MDHPSSCEITEESVNDNHSEKIYVALSKSVKNSLSSLRWCFKTFAGLHVSMLHVHQPSHFIPTILGRLPASHANAEVVAAYRMEERRKMRNLLERYLFYCRRAKIDASYVVTECEHYHQGISELVMKHNVRKLVMWTRADSFIKVNRIFIKEGYAAYNAPPFCEILFINKGGLIWKKENSEKIPHPPGEARTDKTVIKLDHCKVEIPPISLSSTPDDYSIDTLSRTHEWVQTKLVSDRLPAVSSSYTANKPHGHASLPTSLNNATCSDDLSERRDVPVSDNDESSYFALLETTVIGEVVKGTAREGLLRIRKLESETLEAMNKVNFFQLEFETESSLKSKAATLMNATLEEQQKLLKERDEISRHLQKVNDNIALLNSNLQDANYKRDEVARKIEMVESQIAFLHKKGEAVRRQNMEISDWLERWRNRLQESDTVTLASKHMEKLPEYSLSDLLAATCNFSKDFLIGRNGFGLVFKGEMLGRTVIIKKLHAHNLHCHLRFQEEVQIIGKLQHPHLATLLGSCPAAWSLVYEYVPNGNLHGILVQKPSIPWSTLARIVAEISSALAFLHSYSFHGDLKPQNILLDAELRCKIDGYGICNLVKDASLCSPSFRQTESTNAFPYAAPELHRKRSPTAKSDVYSLGVIILQLLTGKSPRGIVNEVRKAASGGKLQPILDESGGEWPTYAARRLADLALQFCESNEEDRPELTGDLVKEIEGFRCAEGRAVPSCFVCPILKEIMYDPQIAADGFTYEGEAIREWVEGGHHSSPMTNLTLNHLHLTPNHTLRLAIRSWFSNPHP